MLVKGIYKGMKPTVLIAAKKTNDALVRVGVPGVQTADYALAGALLGRLREQGVEGILCNTDHSAVTSDIDQFQTASILIAVTLSADYLNAAKNVIATFSNTASRKVIFLNDKSSDGSLEAATQSYCGSGSQLETYTLGNGKTIETFSKYIVTRLRTEKPQKAKFDSNVMRILKRAMPLSEELPHVIEREWLDHQLDRWITGTSRKRICWVKGEHGSGKTSFIGDYCTRLKSGAKSGIIGGGIYNCNSTETRIQNADRIIMTIAHGLCCCVEGYEEAIRGTVLDDHFSDLAPENMIQELLIDPFKDNPDLVPKPEDGRFVFAIDGIDELKTNKYDALEGFLNLLKYLNNLNHFIRIIITSTPDQSIDNALTRIHAMKIDLTNEHYTDQKQDAERFLRHELETRGIPHTQDDIFKILSKAEWNFDYLHHFIAQCDDDDSKKLPSLDQLPKGLLAKYEFDFEQMFSQQYYQEKVKPIIQILIAAYEPLSISDIVQILQKESNEIKEVIYHSRLTQFLKEFNRNTSTTIALYSVSLENWLCERNHHFSIDVDVGKAKIIEWIQNGSKGEYKYYSFYKNDYLQKYAMHHLLDSQKIEVINELIIRSKPDDFEKLKALLGALFINEEAGRRGWKCLLLQIFQDRYNYRIRDILVYIYRYILKRKGANYPVLQQLIDILKSKQEGIRAELLLGEGFDNYQRAFNHFQNTINLAKEAIENGRSIERVNIWWDVRMHGVAYNRLANLENKSKHREKSESLYFIGKAQFEEAKNLFNRATLEEREAFKEDITIIERDLGISNERLGDIAFSSGNYKAAEEYYRQFYQACNLAYASQAYLRTKWDLSISLLRLGDAECCLGKTAFAQDHYKTALNLRREILQHMRSDCMDALPRPFYIEFTCPNMYEFDSTTNMEMFKESRDIDPIRDIAMCYARLGDLAYVLNQKNVALEYYEALVKLCERNNKEVQTATSEHDLVVSRSRKTRIVN